MNDQELRNFIAENWKAIRELRESQKQTDEQMKKTDEQMKKTDEQMKKTDEQMKKTDERLKTLGERFGDFGNNRGEEVEDFFYRYFEKHPVLPGVSFDAVERNIITADGNEHDIILINGKTSALISVKYKLHKKDIDHFVEEELTRVKRLLQNFGSNHTIYGGVASYIIKDEVQKYAESKGLYTITRSGDNTVFLNQKDFRAKAL